MAEGTILAELVLEGDRTFKRAVESSGEQMDDAASDATGLSAALGFAGERMDSLSGDSLSLAGVFQALQGRANEAGDEIRGAGRSALTTSGHFAGLAASTEGLSIAFGTLSTVGIAGLATSFALLSTTLLPLAATLGTVAIAATGLAGAFGLVIGSGILAFGKQRAQQNERALDQVNQQIRALEEQRRQEARLSDAHQRQIGQYRERINQLQRLRAQQGGLSDRQKHLLTQYQAEVSRLQELRAENQGLSADQQQQLQTLQKRRAELKEQTTIMGALSGAMSDLRKELAPLIVSFGQQFVPLIKDGIAGIAELVRNTLDAVGGMGVFADAIRSAGETAFNIIPQIAGRLADLARRSLPFLEDLGAWLLETGPSAFREMLATTEDVGPELLAFGEAVIEALPALNDLGILVLETIIPALLDIGRALQPVFKWFGRLDRGVQRLAVGVGVLSPLLGGVVFAARTLGRVLGGVWRVLKPVGRFIGRRLVPVLSRAGGVLRSVASRLGLASAGSRILGSRLAALATGPVGAAILAFTTLFQLFDEGILSLDQISRTIQDTVDSIIGGIASFLQNQAPGLLNSAFEAFGRSLREAFLAVFTDLMNLATGQESVLGNVIAAIGSYLVNDAPGDVWEAFKTLFDLVWSSLTGFISGVLGTELSNSIARAINHAIPDTIGFQIPEFEVGGRTFGGDSVQVALPNDPIATRAVPEVPQGPQPQRGQETATPQSVRLGGKVQIAEEGGDLYMVMDDRAEAVVEQQAQQSGLQ